MAWVLICMVSVGVYGYIPGLASEVECHRLAERIITTSPTIPDLEQPVLLREAQCIEYRLSR